MVRGEELTLMKHQQQVVQRILQEGEKGLAVFMATGTGKTATMVRAASAWFAAGRIEAMLVIAPNGVHRQWVNEEVPKWVMPGIRYAAYDGKKLTRMPPCVEGVLNIVAVNVDTFSTKDKWHKFVKWCMSCEVMLVVDECTSIKTPTAQRTKNVMKLAQCCKYKYVLTGTPLTSGPYDVYNPVSLVRGNYFGVSYKMFQMRYGMWATQNINGRAIQVQINHKTWKAIKACPTYEAANALFNVTLDTYDLIQHQEQYVSPYRRTDELIDILKPCSVFINLEDCVDMPDKVYIQRHVEMSPQQRTAYKSMEDELIAGIPNGDIVEDIKMMMDVAESPNKVSAYMKLRQITSGYLAINYSMDEEGDQHDWHLDECEKVHARFFKEQSKLEQLKVDVSSILGEPGSSDSQVIVCCNFTAEAGNVYDHIVNKWGYTGVLKTGSVCEGSVDDFKEGNAQVLVANIKCIAEGYNLQQRCHHMIFFSNTWSLKDRLQVEARIYRIGQKHKCMYLDYIHTGTIDEHVLANMDAKREVFTKAQDAARGFKW